MVSYLIVGWSEKAYLQVLFLSHSYNLQEVHNQRLTNKSCGNDQNIFGFQVQFNSQVKDSTLEHLLGTESIINSSKLGRFSTLQTPC